MFSRILPDDILPVKCLFKELCILLPVIIQDMRVLVRDHLGLRMTGIALNCFNITPVQFQLIGDTGMSQAVKYHRREIMLLNQLLEGFC